MADSTITTQGVILYDRWPGFATAPPIDNIQDMTSSVVGHNQATPKYNVGTKWVLYNDTKASDVGVKCWRGWSTFVYLKSAADISTAIAGSVNFFCVPDDTIVPTSENDALYTVVADTDRTTHETLGLVACAISTMTDGYFGWFWCGGVAPLQYVPGMLVASVFQTDDSLYSPSTVTALTPVATTATEIGLMAAATGGQTQIIGEAVYADGA